MLQEEKKPKNGGVGKMGGLVVIIEQMKNFVTETERNLK